MATDQEMFLGKPLDAKQFKYPEGYGILLEEFIKEGKREFNRDSFQELLDPFLEQRVRPYWLHFQDILEELFKEPQKRFAKSWVAEFVAFNADSFKKLSKTGELKKRIEELEVENENLLSFIGKQQKHIHLLDGYKTKIQQKLRDNSIAFDLFEAEEPTLNEV